MILRVLASVLLGGLCAAAAAAEWPPAAPLPYVVGGQATIVWQHLPAFHSPYQGPHSLRATTDDAVSDSYTLYTGVALRPWLEVYVDPEMIRGGGVGGALGLAGYTNGEVIRNPGIGQDPYLARAFLRVTVPLGGEREQVAAGDLQVPGSRPVDRLTLTAGILAATDLFDANAYANDTRAQFLNWTFINDLAWDFAADTRGYSRGAVLEWTDGRFALRFGSFQMPTVANGPNLDGDLLAAHGDQLEVEARPELLAGRPAAVRLLAYDNHARMGDYGAALTLPRPAGTAPDITRTRRRGRVKYGVGLDLEQPLTADGATGLFARLGWNDGATESFAFTECDRTASVGAQVGGAPWHRPDDRVGLAGAANGLSRVHADYLAAGGLGFALGDGRLRYGPETIMETYYAVQALPGVTLSLDYQFIARPGYNRDRGPVSVVGLRFHLAGLLAHE